MANEPLKNKKEKKYFFRDFKAELKKVIWPTPKQLVNNTIAVLTIVLIVAFIVSILDFVFNNINQYGIENIKKIVQKVDVNEEESNLAGDINEEESIDNLDIEGDI